MSKVFPGILVWLVLLALPAVAAQAAAAASPLRPVHTYSIVARDPGTGQLGVAVQSHWFSVGTLVPWAEAGVGAVATQSFVEVRYGVAGLELMRTGVDARRALEALRATDPTPQVRQVAMIDAGGTVAAFTGENCIQYAGDVQGENFSVQANLMHNPGVPAAMAEAFRKATGSLAERMLAALEAAQALGGDLRGKQSAALLVVRGESGGRPWEDRLVDLHVEDHRAPLQELRRLYTLQTAYDFMNRGDHALERGDVDAALSYYGRAEKLLPANQEMKFWHAVSLANAGRLNTAVSLFAGIFAQEPQWRELVPRLQAAGLLDIDAKALERILHSATPAVTGGGLPSR
jgi:uncharacterized Ntn-hydrolase superfamily protein